MLFGVYDAHVYFVRVVIYTLVIWLVCLSGRYVCWVNIFLNMYHGHVCALQFGLSSLVHSGVSACVLGSIMSFHILESLSIPNLANRCSVSWKTLFAPLVFPIFPYLSSKCEKRLTLVI